MKNGNMSFFVDLTQDYTFLDPYLNGSGQTSNWSKLIQSIAPISLGDWTKAENNSVAGV